MSLSIHGITSLLFLCKVTFVKMKALTYAGLKYINIIIFIIIFIQQLIDNFMKKFFLTLFLNLFLLLLLL